jgi:FAD/FMN-containing dehydrogenase
MSDLVSRLRALVGESAVLTGDDAVPAGMARSRLGKPVAVVRPASTEQVSAVLRLCHELGQAVVPWGGCTGLSKARAPTALSHFRCSA